MSRVLNLGCMFSPLCATGAGSIGTKHPPYGCFEAWTDVPLRPFGPDLKVPRRAPAWPSGTRGIVQGGFKADSSRSSQTKAAIEMSGSGITMTRLANMLTGPTERAILDRSLGHV